MLLLGVSSTSGLPPAGGAPPAQVAGATAAGLLLTLVLLGVGRLHRNGWRGLDVVARPFSRLLGVPAWAALPAALATASVLVAGAGFYWDVSVHIDQGRDPGPFGTAAHYPILLGLFGIFSAGWLALAMPRGEDAARTGVRISPRWCVPTSGLVLAACGAFALAGFPLDDLWHAVFGQDVTLWGPTHLILLTGGQLAIVAVLGLIGEGRAARRAAHSAPARPRTHVRRSPVALAVGVSGAGGILTALSIYQGEFDFGVPQFRLLFEPVLLAFAAGLGLVMARAMVGRGGALAAAVFHLVVTGGFALLVGPVLGRDAPHFPTYLGAALLVELAALAVPPEKRIRTFAVVAGVLVGTLGTLVQWGWSHLWMPIPWPAHFVPGAIALAVPAAVCGGIVGAFVAGALAPARIARPGRRAWLPAAVGTAVLGVILASLVPTTAPAGATARVALRPAGDGRVQATVSVRPASLADGADFFQGLAWQGHARMVQAPLERLGGGRFVTTTPLPVHGHWKALLRLQHGQVKADVPVFLPADPAIPVAGVPAPAHFARAFTSDTQLMQRERKRGIPTWAWSAATSVVLAINVVLLAIIGWGLDRVARLRTGDPAPPERDALPSRPMVAVP